mgnify:CR=1 FL=1
MDKWANGYTEIASNDNDFVSVSSDKSTLAYGKTLAGTNYNYASVAWSAINSTDEDNDGYDFSPSGSIDGHDYVATIDSADTEDLYFAFDVPADSNSFYTVTYKNLSVEGDTDYTIETGAWEVLYRDKYV